MYPKSLDNLISSFMRLPGVGKRSAERYAYFVTTKFNKEEIDNLITSLANVSNKVKKCPTCGFLTENDICEYCKDDSRLNDTILVVEEAKDVEAIERCNRYNGRYHVLGGAISPLNGIGPDELNIDTLLKRIESGNVKEVIIASSATVEGEATALYISKLLKDKPITISRIAYGMPVGSSLEYSDEGTITRALEGRKKY